MAFFIIPSDYRSDRSASDRDRHRQKIRETIRDNIADIIAEESIIGQAGDKVIKIPIRGVKEYRFVYGDDLPGAGSGDGTSQPGDQLGDESGDGSPMGDKAGDKPGSDYYETDITLEELTDILFEDLQLPDLERKKLRLIESERLLKPRGTRKKGVKARLDKKRSAVERVKRKLSAERSRDEKIEERFPFHQDDLRYKRVTDTPREESNAVVVCIMDTSGSMDTTKKFLARSFFFLLYQFVRIKYRQTDLVFISHHTTAQEVSEEEFFTKGESGGTFISSGYLKALEVIETRYHPTLWNVYAFHCSDGDNWAADNENAVNAAQKIALISNLFGYSEIKPEAGGLYDSSMFPVFAPIVAENFVRVKIGDKGDIWRAFKKMMAAER